MTQANLLASLFCNIEKVLQIELLVFILILLAERGKVFTVLIGNMIHCLKVVQFGVQAIGVKTQKGLLAAQTAKLVEFIFGYNTRERHLE